MGICHVEWNDRTQSWQVLDALGVRIEHFGARLRAREFSVAFAEREKARCAAMRRMGLWTDRQIAAAFGIDPKSVRRYAADYEEGRIMPPLWERVGSDRVDP